MELISFTKEVGKVKGRYNLKIPSDVNLFQKLAQNKHVYLGITI